MINLMCRLLEQTEQMAQDIRNDIEVQLMNKTVTYKGVKHIVMEVDMQAMTVRMVTNNEPIVHVTAHIKELSI